MQYFCMMMPDIQGLQSTTHSCGEIPIGRNGAITKVGGLNWWNDYWFGHVSANTYVQISPSHSRPAMQGMTRLFVAHA